MKHLKQEILLALVLFITTIIPSAAQEDNGGKISAQKNKISIENFIEKGCENNPEFKNIIIDRLYLEYKDDLSLDIGEIIADFEAGYQYSPDTDKDGIKSGIKISRLFPETGTDISASFNTSPGAFERSSSLSLQVSQEIAENSFGKKWQLEKDSVSLQKNLITYQIAEAYEDYVYYLVSIYYNWLSSWHELEAAENSYRESGKLFNNIKERMKNNIADQADVDRSELQLLSKMELTASAENNYAKAAIMALDAAGLSNESDYFPENSKTEFIGKENQSIPGEKISRMSRTYRILDLYEKIGEKNVNIGKNSLLPQISLFSEFSASGTDYTLAEERERILSFGIAFSGFGARKKDQAALETVKIDLNKKKLENIITKKDLDITIKNHMNDIENKRMLAEIYEKKTILAEKILEDDRKKYRIGKIDLSRLIDSINSVDNYRIKKLNYESEINILGAGWMNLTDSLISETDDSISGYKTEIH